MKTLTAIAVASLLVLTACGVDAAGNGATTPTTSVAPRVTGSLHMSGGLEGREETWVLEADGTVLGPDGYVGTVTASDHASLAAAVDAAWFFDLDAEYLPEDQCCDRFVYVLTLTQGSTSHTVTTIDAAEAPAALFDLIGTFLDAVRPGA